MRYRYQFVAALFFICWFVNGAYAEQGCAPGFFPGGTQPGSQICVPIPGYGTTNNVQEPSSGAGDLPSWVNRYGAIAIDDSAVSGGIGTSAGEASKGRAKKTAIARCKASGGARCQIKIAYMNACGVIVAGDNYYSTASGPTQEKAVDLASGECNGRTENCKTFYAECSLPERNWGGR